MQQESAGRGRPRRAETDEKIRAATMELIREQGPEAVNVAAVSARSGIARTTIYRRYEDREALLRDALQRVVSRGEPPEEQSVRQKLVWVLTQTQEVLANSIGLGGVAALVADRDPDFSTALRASLDSALRPIHEQITDDLARGRLAPHADADVVVSLVLGAYLAEILRYGELRPEWLERTAGFLAASLGLEPQPITPTRSGRRSRRSGPVPS